MNVSSRVVRRRHPVRIADHVKVPRTSQPPVAGLALLQRPAVMPAAMMPHSVGASRAKMRSDSRFPISRGDYALADLVTAADDGDWRLYWPAPWYVVGPPFDNFGGHQPRSAPKPAAGVNL